MGVDHEQNTHLSTVPVGTLPRPVASLPRVDAVEGRAARSAVLRRVAVLVALQGLALVLTGVLVAVLTARGDPDDRSGSVALCILVLVTGLAVLSVARSLDRRAGWAWAPTILLQVFALIAAVGALQAGSPLVAVPLGLWAAAVLCHLATPQARGAREP